MSKTPTADSAQARELDLDKPRVNKHHAFAPFPKESAEEIKSRRARIQGALQQLEVFFNGK